MGLKNTERVEHPNEDAPTTFRNFFLDKILNEINETGSGQGYTEITRTGAFITKLETWVDDTKTLKRSQIEISRSGPFVSQIILRMYDDETGLTEISRVTHDFDRDVNNFVESHEGDRLRL